MCVCGVNVNQKSLCICTGHMWILMFKFWICLCLWPSVAAKVISQGETKPLSAYRAQGQIRINMIKYGWMLIKLWPSVALTKRIIWKGRHYYRGSCRSSFNSKGCKLQITHLGFIYYTMTKRDEGSGLIFFFMVVKSSSLLHWFIVL